MTDSEIVKVLECCTTNGASCKDCPAFVKVDRSNCKKYFRGALDLINRLQAENERLLQKTQRPQDADPMDFCGVLCDFAEGLIAKAKTQAYKEFAERLTEEIVNDIHFSQIEKDYLCVMINNLLKELVGEDNV